MITVTQTEFRNNIRKYLDAVEGGEEIEICRHGKPLATVTLSRRNREPAWKQLDPPLRIPGVSLSDMIIAEREEGW